MHSAQKYTAAVSILVRLAAAVAFSSSTVALADLSYSINADGKLVLMADSPEGVVGLDFASEAGLLIPGDDPSPFLFYLSNTPHSVVMASVPSPVVIDGEVTLSTGYDGDDATARQDLTFSYGGEGSSQQLPFPVCPHILNDHLYGRVSGNDCDNQLVDFGQVQWGDASSGLLADKISIHNFGGPYEVTGIRFRTRNDELAFNIPDFEEFHLAGEGSSMSFDLQLDTRLPPGRYEATATVTSFLTLDTPEGQFRELQRFELFQFRAEIVPEPASGGLLMLTVPLAVGTLRRRRNGNTCQPPTKVGRLT